MNCAWKVLPLFVATALVFGCSKKDDDDEDKEETLEGAMLTLGTPHEFSGPTTSSDGLIEPFKASLNYGLQFKLDAETKLKGTVTDIVWGEGCGQTGGPYIAYGVKDSNNYTVAPDDGVIQDPVAAGEYDLLVSLLSENPCTLTSAKFTLSAQ